MTHWLQPIQLSGTHIDLVPTSQDHAADLAAVISKGSLDALWYTMIPAGADIADEIDRRLALQARGSMLAFTVIDTRTGKAVGMTTYMNADAVNRRVEIGSTWYCKSVQRSAVNTECKLRLLEHAFDQLDCIAVEFRTHYINHQSRQAIERLGAKLDGVLRAHMIMPNGTLRDTAVYSILATEWPTIRSHLQWELTKPR